LQAGLITQQEYAKKRRHYRLTLMQKPGAMVVPTSDTPSVSIA
jgi:hypothetical protein